MNTVSRSIVQTRTRPVAAAVLMAFVLGACSGMTHQEKSTATGAVVGGVAGAVVTGGSTVGTGVGAVVGGVVGHEVGKK